MTPLEVVAAEAIAAWLIREVALIIAASLKHKRDKAAAKTGQS